MTKLRKCRVYSVPDGDGHSDQMDEYSERGEYYYADDVDAEIERLNLKCGALAYLQYGSSGPDDPWRAKLDEVTKPLHAEIESLRKALDNRGRQLGIQQTVHEPLPCAALTRYQMVIGREAQAPYDLVPCEVEHPAGEWVKYEDVRQGASRDEPLQQRPDVCKHPVLRDDTEQPERDIYVCTACGTKLNLYQYRVEPPPGYYRGFIPHEERIRSASRDASSACNHDLTTSNPTVIVDGKYDARCYVCKEEWHIPYPTPQGARDSKCASCGWTYGTHSPLCYKHPDAPV